MHKTFVVPTTLLGVMNYFADPDVALAFFTGMRWPDGDPACPHCGAKKSTFMASRRIWNCKACRKQFSAKQGTIFEDSPIKLNQWLAAIWLIANAKNGISSYELGRALGVTQKTAWFMNHRIRLAMQSGRMEKMRGEVEVDETFIGGRARFMHKDKKSRVIRTTGPSGKAAVIGLLERHGPGKTSRVRAGVVGTIRRSVLHGAIHATVAPGATIMTDDLESYKKLDPQYVHEVIDHAECYAKGKVHTNGLENFWSLLKRGIKGTYVSVEPFHLFRYLDEQVFRFNNRKTKDGARFIDALRGIIGKRLTYEHLIGAHLEPATT